MAVVGEPGSTTFSWSEARPSQRRLFYCQCTHALEQHWYRAATRDFVCESCGTVKPGIPAPQGAPFAVAGPMVPATAAPPDLGHRADTGPSDQVTGPALGKRWPLEEARAIGVALMGRLGPKAERMMIAGSIRRQAPHVGDAELLYIPAGEPDQVDQEIRAMIAEGLLALRTKKGGGPIGYGKLNRFLTDRRSGLGLDIFTTTAEYWGMSLVVRTGPEGFNVKMMTRFRQLGLRGHAYGGVSVWDKDARRWRRNLPCPTEEDVFQFLQWEYIPPEARA